MRLLIISNMRHYRRGREVVGWGPTVQEIDHLAELFDEIRHIACLYAGAPPPSCLPYQSGRVTLVPVPPAGGEGLRDKLGVLWQSPRYLRAIWRELGGADVVHVRCPANISLLGLLLLSVVRRPRRRWVKYAGNWRPAGGEAWSYRLQRWLLERGWVGGVVTVNGEWAGQPAHVRSFFNPCLTEAELANGRELISGKQLSAPLRLLYVGRLDAAKGIERALHILSRLRERGVPARFDLVGDGVQRRKFEATAAALGVSHLTTFHGWLPRPALPVLYAQSHLLLLPTSSSEGLPKAMCEAMAYGVVPVAGRVGSIPQYLERFGVGRTFEPDDIEKFVEAIVWYVSHPQEWKKEAQNGVRMAELFSYRHYIKAVRKLLNVEVDGEVAGAAYNLEYREDSAREL